MSEPDSKTPTPAEKALYVFSDAHFGCGTPDEEQTKLQKLIRLCELVKAEGERLVILGDLFDFWFEYKYAIPKHYTEILFKLRELTDAGIVIDYISGNHDFWMADFFPEQMGITVHLDTLDMEFAGKRIHFTHGDGLAPADRGYRLMKRILRNPVCVWLYRKLPPDWAFPLAKAVSGKSRGYNSGKDLTFEPDYENYARARLTEGYDIVAIGHLHKPIRKRFPEGIYINSGDFISSFSYVRIDSDTALLHHL